MELEAQRRSESRPAPESPQGWWSWAQWRIAVVMLVIFGVVVAWYLTPVLLLLFSGVLLAVLLNMPAAWIAKHTPLPTAFALVIVLMLLVLFLALLGWWFAPRLLEQLEELAQVTAGSLSRLEHFIGQYRWGNQLLDAVEPGADIADNVVTISTLPRLMSALATLFGGLTEVFVVLFLGIYLAAVPSLYVNGVVHLFPHNRRARTREVLSSTGEMLRRWLLTRLVEMVVIGSLTGIGLWLLGVPLAPILGLIAGILNFIPIIGTYLAIIPAALVALAQGPMTLFYVILVYLGAQFVQDYLLSPMVESRLVRIPPGLMLTSHLLFALLGGMLGVAMAVPIAVVVMVWVKLLYVEDVLGDPVDLPGEP